MAPPMSLSAPVLGGSEMPPPSLRAAVSSSEIMYELAMARLSKEADEEEAEANLQQRYGLNRKRSFERKTSKKNEAGQFKENMASMENLSWIEQDLLEQQSASQKSGAELPKPPPRRTSDLNKRDTSTAENFTERFMALEKSYENYNQKFDFDDRFASDIGSDMERSFDYYDEVAEDEDTYHPRGTTGIFTPIAVQLPSREFAERIPSPQSLGPPPLITISEDEEKESAKVQKPATEKVPEVQFPRQTIQKVIVRETISPERVPELPPVVKLVSDTIEPPQVVRRQSPSPKAQLTPVEPRRSPSPSQLKPILKTRDRSAERSDRSDVSDSEAPKRVRIEEPNDKKNIDMYAKEENDMGLQAGEVARNRRKGASAKPQPPSGGPSEPIVVNIYSDIIREYNRQIKGPKPKKLYLNYDELKMAADKSMGNTPAPTLEEIEASARAERQNLSQQSRTSTEPPQKSADKASKTAENPAEAPEVDDLTQSEALGLPTPRKLYMEYLLDLFLFLVAVWLYVFKDPRLTIPILMLMVYRQLHETVNSKISAIANWFKPKEE